MPIARALRPQACFPGQQQRRRPPSAAAAARAFAPRTGYERPPGCRAWASGVQASPRLPWQRMRQRKLTAAAAAAAEPGDGREQPESGGGGDAEAALERLQQLLQQQQGIDSAAAAQLAAELAERLAYADPARRVPVDEALSALQFFVRHGMRPDKAARLAAAICKGGKGRHASFIRQWQTWEPVFAANWQLADSYLAAYQQQCIDTQQRPAKGSESLAALLSDRPSKYNLLRVSDLQQRLAALQQGELSLTAADVGQLLAAGLNCAGSQETIAAAIGWLVRFAGSIEGALSMLCQAPSLTSNSTATLDSKLAALKAAWAGALQPGQVEQLVRRYAVVLATGAARYAETAVVLRGWFPQPSELWAVLQKAPRLIGVRAATLAATERWMTGPPLGLSRQQFLQLVVQRPQSFVMDLAAPLTQHKLAFLVQVGGVPLKRALGKHIGYLQLSTLLLAGRYFLLSQHGVPLPRHADGGMQLSYAKLSRQALLRLLRRHDSAGRLPADDREAEAYLRAWLRDWPETESGRRWAKPPAPQ